MKKILISLTLVMVIITAILISMTSNRTNQSQQLSQSGTSSQDQSQGQGEALIGGDFTLVDTAGGTVKDADFRGKVMLVFFGFTHCPDICPVTLTVMSNVMGQLALDKAAKLAPIFITVDPERDTVPVMAEYMESFDKRIVGLTGTPEQIKATAAAYRAYYAKSKGLDASKDEPTYLMDHSGFIYVMGMDGKFIRALSHDTPEGDIMALLRGLLEK